MTVEEASYGYSQVGHTEKVLDPKENTNCLAVRMNRTKILDSVRAASKPR